MVRGKRKTVTFDAMVKFFMQHYEIPTKKDVDRLYARLDRLEKLIRAGQSKARQAPGAKGSPGAATRTGKQALTASDRVYGIIKRSKNGLSISDIKRKTQFEDKKLRNILFRLNSLGRIKRISRGVYTAS